ncbi:ATP synthase F1, alpha subunit [Enterococcus sp. DIV0840]|uniref:F0F1 ATP synthase subunit alpha n=1 Tax=Enterococcus TaxID=1350 RepID=UPI001A8DD073|nr:MULTISPECIES: F0F1 ATP synthase subunit alpha [Enterococcus]MBO0434606.1 F0F1 ATP synthase subunit alpha [Enterococcus sp. DIV0849a]MBO0472176.1 F0F1 ATP synthase subunit alpha [Enterococcus ureasiticus]
MKFEEYNTAKFETAVDIDFLKENGQVESISDGIVFCSGLESSFYNELVIIDDRFHGTIMELQEELVGIGVVEDTNEIREGMSVKRTGQPISVRISANHQGKVINPLGESLYGDSDAFEESTTVPMFSVTQKITFIDSVSRPLETGIMILDTLLPIGKGQRQLILGDRQTGKTQLALDTIINQKGKNVHCIFVSVGLKIHYITEVIEVLKEHDAMAYTTIVATTSSDSVTSQYLTPYAGMAMAESLMKKGEDVLIVLDNLTKHADVYRTISLLFSRPPGREAYPGDIFYIHSSLLERAVQMNEAHKGGSITALPIIETLSNDVSAYVPTNVVSITDGQILLKADLFNSGQKPAVDVSVSVSRIGGDAQYPIIRQLSKGLNLLVSQYYDLKELLDFGNALDDDSQVIVDKGRILLEIFKQGELLPLSSGETAALLYVIKSEEINNLETKQVQSFRLLFLEKIKTADWFDELNRTIQEENKLGDEFEQQISTLAVEVRQAVQ